MGYDATIRRPLALSFTGTAGDDAKLLGFAYAYERAAQIRRTPSEINPQTWHCVAPVGYLPRTCGPGELSPAEVPPVQVETPVGGTVPATLSLTLGAPATFGAFTPGVAREYTASTTANVISTALDATLTVDASRARLMNGTFALAQPVQVRDRRAGELDRAGVQRPGDDRVQAGDRRRTRRCGPASTPRR